MNCSVCPSNTHTRISTHTTHLRKRFTWDMAYMLVSTPLCPPMAMSPSKPIRVLQLMIGTRAFVLHSIVWVNLLLMRSCRVRIRSADMTRVLALPLGPTTAGSARTSVSLLLLDVIDSSKLVVLEPDMNSRHSSSSLLSLLLSYPRYSFSSDESSRSRRMTDEEVDARPLTSIR